MKVVPYIAKSRSPEATSLLYWRVAVSNPFDAADQAFCLAMLRATAVHLIAGE